MTITARSEDDVEESVILEKVKKSSGKYHTVGQLLLNSVIHNKMLL